MLKLLKTFNQDSQILIKLFPDNVNWNYINRVVGKHCFDRTKQPQNIDNSFSQFDLRYGAVAIGSHSAKLFCE